MFKKTNLLPAAVLLALAPSVLAVIHEIKRHTPASLNIRPQTSEQKIKHNDDDLPIFDLAMPATPDEKKEARRKAKGRKYSNPVFPISEKYFNISHVLEGGPRTPLPVEQSNLIIIGEVTNAEAILSNDGSSVYSESTLRVNEVLKNDSTESIAKGDSVIVERQGGRFRLPSGKLAVERIIGTRMPLVGEVYVLFLIQHPDNSMNIHAGYELSENQAVPSG